MAVTLMQAVSYVNAKICTFIAISSLNIHERVAAWLWIIGISGLAETGPTRLKLAERILFS